LHGFSGFNGPIITDSGGFQAFSLIRGNSKFGRISPGAIRFKRDGKKITLSPEKCVQIQAALGSDVIMCLDYCTHPNDPYETQKVSVETTVRWAKRCKDEYSRIFENKKSKPFIFAIIQGGSDRRLRKECADALTDIGFDGFGYGGWPLNEEGRLTEEILEYTAELMTDGGAKYAMGVGKPENIVKCVKMGYGLFDCVAPTREARHNQLYVFNGTDVNEPGFYSYYYPLDDVHRRDRRPVSDLCDCHMCRNFSRSYIRHLLSVNDPQGARLLTIHNLRFYTMLTDALRDE
jgi:queuine tRNA-ribosyltransferase